MLAPPSPVIAHVLSNASQAPRLRVTRWLRNGLNLCGDLPSQDEPCERRGGQRWVVSSSHFCRNPTHIGAKCQHFGLNTGRQRWLVAWSHSCVDPQPALATADSMRILDQRSVVQFMTLASFGTCALRTNEVLYTTWRIPLVACG